MLRILQEGLSDVPGVIIHGTTSLKKRVAVLSITVKNRDSSGVGTSLLDVDHDINVRAGLQCAPLIHEQMGTSPMGTVRFSPGPFTTKENVLSAVRAVEKIATKRNNSVPMLFQGTMGREWERRRISIIQPLQASSLFHHFPRLSQARRLP